MGSTKRLSYTLIDIYKRYVKETDSDIPYVRFKRILEEINKTILDKLLMRSEAFKMPLGLGCVCIVKYKPKSMSAKSLSVDYKASKECDKKIYHLNEHSDGYKYRLFWSKVPMTFADRYKYQLNLVRANKRMLAQLIFNKQDYLNIDDI